METKNNLYKKSLNNAHFNGMIYIIIEILHNIERKLQNV